MRVILLAGGKGTRLYPYTSVFPKPLMPLGDKPVMEVLIRRLKSYGIDHVTLCVGHLAPLVESFFKDGKWLGVKIDYSMENKPLGTVGPLTLLKDLPDYFIVTNGDLLTDANFGQMIRLHKKEKADLTIGVYKREERIDLGVLETKGKRITGYKEKPVYNFYVSTGLYVFNKKILEFLPKNEYYDFPTLVNTLLSKKKKIVSYQIKGYWLDIGRPDDYQKAIDKFSNERNGFLPKAKK